MSVFVADDFDTIRARMKELTDERARDAKRCRGKCGEPVGRIHLPGCEFHGSVIESET